MVNRLHTIIRAVLCLIIVCGVWLTPPQTAPSLSQDNIQAITSICGPVDTPFGMKVKTASQHEVSLSLMTVVRSTSSFTKPVCYSEPFAEITELLQFRTSLTKTASLTTSS